MQIIRARLGSRATRTRERRRELSVIGDWFTTSMGLTFGERRYALVIEKGGSPTSSRRRASSAHAVRRARAGDGVAQVSQPNPRRCSMTSSPC